jgi:hypothetical protein
LISRCPKKIYCLRSVLSALRGEPNEVFFGI